MLKMQPSNLSILAKIQTRNLASRTPVKEFDTFGDYRKAWENAYVKDPPMPLNVDIELASLCNLRCPFCFIPDPKFEKFIKQKADDGGALRRLMPKELAYKIIDQCAKIGVPAIKFNWRGESTLHPDYSRIVQYARNFSDRNEIMEILANTNANCSDRAIDGLMACTKVMVSLDSLVPDTYAQMRIGGDFERAKNVISELVRRKHPNLWVRRVMTKLNFGEPFFEMVRGTWGENVKVSQHYCFDRNAAAKQEVVGCDHDSEAKIPRTKRRYCGYPSQRLVISSTGKVYPCCIDLHETMPVGDICEQSLMEIWRGQEISKLRDNLRNVDNSREWNPTCQNCESWMSYDAPQRSFVQDIQLVQEGLHG